VGALPGDGGGTVVTAASRNLDPGENLTVVVGFDPHTFVEGTPPPPVDLGPAPPAWAVVSSVLGGVFAFVGGIVAAIAGRRKRATATGFIVPQYSVPKDLDVMVAAELIERSSTAVQAQLVSLAVKKKVRLLGYAVTDADSADYAVQYLGAKGLDGKGLDSWEKAVITALFGDKPKAGDARDLQKSGDSDLADALRPIVAALPDAIPASGFVGPKVRSKGALWWRLAVLALVVIAFVGAIFSGWVGFVLGFGAFFSGGLGILIALVGTRKRPTLSTEGAQTVDYLLGMKMYMDLAEKDRFAVLQSATGAERVDTGDGKQVVKLYEKLLPWAVIWGVEESWARELEVQLQQTGEQLDWYEGSTPFQAYAFASLLSGVQTGINPPVSTSGSSWSSSGGSSFSGGSFGGGFSGGGGGGGGGGGR
jgi:uncharacterized membrane protein YgcG